MAWVSEGNLPVLRGTGEHLAGDGHAGGLYQTVQDVSRGGRMPLSPVPHPAGLNVVYHEVPPEQGDVLPVAQGRQLGPGMPLLLVRVPIAEQVVEPTAFGVAQGIGSVRIKS